MMTDEAATESPSSVPAAADENAEPLDDRTGRLHPWPLRIMHWLNAIIMLVMITSGWGIYNDNVIFSWLVFPDWLKLGHWAQDSLLWHFAAMWFLGVNGLFYLIYGFGTGRFRGKFLPIRLGDLISTVRETPWTFKASLSSSDRSLPPSTGERSMDA